MWVTPWGFNSPLPHLWRGGRARLNASDSKSDIRLIRGSGVQISPSPFIIKMKSNKYIVLIIICILTIILIKTLGPSSSSPSPAHRARISQQEITTIVTAKIKDSPTAHLYLFNFLGLTYVGILIFGFVNLILLLSKKLRREPAFSFSAVKKQFPLRARKSYQLFFQIALLTLAVFVAESFLARMKAGTNQINSAIVLNLILEIGVIAIIMKFITREFLELYLKKMYIAPLFRTYATTLVLMLAATILLEKIGLRYQLNPTIELIFALNHKLLFSLLLAQIIIFGPVAEELLFRGFIYNFLRQKFSQLGAAFIVSFFFSLLHRQIALILPLFIISLSLCYIYEKTQNIAVPIVFHSLFNTLNITLVLAMKSLL